MYPHPSQRVGPRTSPGALMRSLLTRPWDLALTPSALCMPGRRHTGPLPALTQAQATLASDLHHDVAHLSQTIGHRSVHTPAGYAAAADWLTTQLAQTGLAPVQRQVFNTPGPNGPVACVNIYLDVQPESSHASEQPMLIYGAHYDSVIGSPAANDNASGVAAVLALARHLANHHSRSRLALTRPIRLALFANEEPPWFWTDLMGSLVLAKAMKRQGLRVHAMLTPETIGYYSDEPGSQLWPPPLAPLLRSVHGDRGDFIAFVGLGWTSLNLVRQCVKSFRQTAQFPSIGAALPNLIPGVGASDHWSFWKQGWPALMITDTAPFRYQWYHTKNDLPQQMNFDKMARVVQALNTVVPTL